MTLTRGPQWRNRFALAPMTNRQSATDGTLAEDELDWLVRRAHGGFGLVMTCAAHVSRNGQGWPGELGIFDDVQLPGLTRLADALRAEGAVSCVQLHHGGMRADSTLVEHRVAPWSDPARGVHALTTAEIADLVGDFVAAAVRAESAGFDGVQIHAAHGYLIAQFLDAVRNTRQDGYGGSAEGRSRFLREIVHGVRRHTGADFQVGLRLSPERWGIDLREARELSEQMMVSGFIDYLDVSLWDVAKYPEDVLSDPRSLLDQFTGLPRGDTRLGVAGKILSAADAVRCLDGGADFVSIGTGAILHHDFANRALTDPGFAATAPPVSTEYLLNESVSRTFIDYLTEIDSDVVRSAVR